MPNPPGAKCPRRGVARHCGATRFFGKSPLRKRPAASSRVLGFRSQQGRGKCRAAAPGCPPRGGGLRAGGWKFPPHDPRLQPAGCESAPGLGGEEPLSRAPEPRSRRRWDRSCASQPKSRRLRDRARAAQPKSRRRRDRTRAAQPRDSSVRDRSRNAQPPSRRRWDRASNREKPAFSTRRHHPALYGKKRELLKESEAPVRDATRTGVMNDVASPAYRQPKGCAVHQEQASRPSIDPNSNR